MLCTAMVAAAIGLQSPSAAPSSPPNPCAAPASRQFDFWAGSWTVKNPQGKIAGTNRIETILGGCALQENWSGAGGMSGTSLNFYDPADGRWHQLWVDGSGTILRLAGGLVDHRMVLEGETPRKTGGAMRHRITWEPLTGGRVRQLWEQSSDGGQSWKVAFDGTYERQR
jgi:hypothetical protein